MKLTTGRFEIDFDPKRGVGQTVRHSDILVAGKPFRRAFLDSWNAPPPRPGPPKVANLLREAFEAVKGVDLAAPKGTLCARDAADRVFEVAVSGVCQDLLSRGANAQAQEYCLWVIEQVQSWEAGGPPGSNYIHRGVPYFFGGIASVRCRNLDLAVPLFEAGDEADEHTFERAGVSTAGLKFPGRAFLRLDPTPRNLLAPVVGVLRGVLDSWLVDFARTSGAPPSSSLTLADLDSTILGQDSLTTECRYLVGYVLRTQIVDLSPALKEVQGRGPWARRQRAELVLGMLTAAEGILRSTVPSAGPRTQFRDVMAEIVIANSPKSLGTAKQVGTELEGIVKSHADSIDICLDYWARWVAAGSTADYPWFVKWVEPGRFIRNKAAHVLKAPEALEHRWDEVERVAKFALFSALWLS